MLSLRSVVLSFSLYNITIDDLILHILPYASAECLCTWLCSIMPLKPCSGLCLLSVPWGVCLPYAAHFLVRHCSFLLHYSLHLFLAWLLLLL